MTLCSEDLSFSCVYSCRLSSLSSLTFCSSSLWLVLSLLLCFDILSRELLTETEGLFARLLPLLVGVVGGVFFEVSLVLKLPPMVLLDRLPEREVAEPSPDPDPILVVCLLVLFL